MHSQEQVNPWQSQVWRPCGSGFPSKCRSFTGRSAGGCIHHKVTNRRSKKTAVWRGDYNAHITYKYNMILRECGVRGREKEGPRLCRATICNVPHDIPCERRSWPLSHPRASAARTSSRFGDPLIGRCWMFGRGIDRATCFVRKQSVRGERLYSA
jgi:hypothetical protein